MSEFKTTHINLDDPETLARLVLNGAIWTLPQYWQKAINFINSGAVKLSDCKDVPTQAKEAIGVR